MIGRDIGKELVAAFGLEGFEVTELHLHVVHDDLVRLDVTVLVHSESIDTLVEELRHYVLCTPPPTEP